MAAKKSSKLPQLHEKAAPLGYDEEFQFLILPASGGNLQVIYLNEKNQPFLMEQIDMATKSNHKIKGGVQLQAHITPDLKTVGAFKRFDWGGTLKEEGTYNKKGFLVGACQSYNKVSVWDGKGTDKKNILSCTEYFDSTQKCIRNKETNNGDGTFAYESFYKSGQPQIVGTTNAQGKFEGPYEEFDENGNTTEKGYKNAAGKFYGVVAIRDNTNKTEYVISDGEGNLDRYDLDKIEGQDVEPITTSRDLVEQFHQNHENMVEEKRNPRKAPQNLETYSIR